MAKTKCLCIYSPVSLMQYADLYLERFEVLFSKFDFIHFICHIKPKIGRFVFFITYTCSFYFMWTSLSKILYSEERFPQEILVLMIYVQLLYVTRATEKTFYNWLSCIYNWLSFICNWLVHPMKLTLTKSCKPKIWKKNKKHFKTFKKSKSCDTVKQKIGWRIY